MTTTPKFVAVVPVGEIVSFVLVSGDSGIVTRKSIPGDTAAENGALLMIFCSSVLLTDTKSRSSIPWFWNENQ